MNNNETRIDLHVHSTASDGLLSPTELVDLARKNNLCALSITDHDTVDGISIAVRYAAENALYFIPGVEFSIECTRGTFHLVGLYVDYTNQRLLSVINGLKTLRSGRAERIMEDLAGNNIHIPFEEVLQEASGAAIGKPHFARVLVRHGYADSMDQVFQRYLIDGKPGDVKREKLSAGEAIEVIKGAGGVPVIAHPISLELEKFSDYEAFIKSVISIGLEGVECYAAMHTPEEVEGFLNLAKKYGLAVTGGSDFHGDRGEEIGKWSKEELIPCGLLEELEAFRGRTRW